MFISEFKQSQLDWIFLKHTGLIINIFYKMWVMINWRFLEKSDITITNTALDLSYFALNGCVLFS